MISSSPSSGFEFPPVIILGAARSGTGLLTHLLKQDRRVAYLSEPRYIWKYKNGAVGHDMLTPGHATPRIKNHIRKKFHDYLNEHGGDVLLEKTPSNTLRFGFVYHIFPEAKYIHIIRDGRKVAASAKKRWCGDFSGSEKNYKQPGRTIQNVTHRKARKKWLNHEARPADLFFDLPYALPLYLNNMGLLKSSVWGPCYPGIRKDYRELELIQVCARQWKICVESVFDFKNSEAFQGDYFEIRYEEIVNGDEKKTEEMFRFAGLDYNKQAADTLKSVSRTYHADSYSSSMSISENEQGLIQNECGELLEFLGYD